MDLTTVFEWFAFPDGARIKQYVAFFHIYWFSSRIVQPPSRLARRPIMRIAGR